MECFAVELYAQLRGIQPIHEVLSFLSATTFAAIEHIALAKLAYVFQSINSTFLEAHNLKIAGSWVGNRRDFQVVIQSKCKSWDAMQSATFFTEASPLSDPQQVYQTASLHWQGICGP